MQCSWPTTRNSSQLLSSHHLMFSLEWFDPHFLEEPDSNSQGLFLNEKKKLVANYPPPNSLELSSSFYMGGALRAAPYFISATLGYSFFLMLPHRQAATPITSSLLNMRGIAAVSFWSWITLWSADKCAMLRSIDCFRKQNYEMLYRLDGRSWLHRDSLCNLWNESPLDSKFD